MNDNVLKFLRQGLLSKQEDRSTYIRQIQNLVDVPSEDKIHAESALKDSTTTINDLENIIDGSHYNNWIKNNVKLDEAIVPIQNNLDGIQTTSNMKSVQNSEDNRHQLEELLDHIPIDENVRIESNPAEILYFLRNGESYTYGRIPDTVSNDRIAKAIKEFEERLPRKDQAFFIEAVNNTFEVLQNKEKHLSTLDKFVTALNTQLDEEERIRVVALLSKKKI